MSLKRSNRKSTRCASPCNVAIDGTWPTVQSEASPGISVNPVTTASFPALDDSTQRP
jgi:hypothetical protein